MILCKISLFFAPFLMSAQTVQESIKQKLETYFSKDAAIEKFVGITKDSFLLYSDSKAKAEGRKPEFSLTWAQVKDLSLIIGSISEKELDHLLEHKDSIDYYTKQAASTPKITGSLKGLKVAIDPGHIGGTYAMGEAESRCMTLQVDSSGHPDSIRLVEGNLTFFTAQILKKKLEDQGAIVILSRPDTGISALDITYQEWKRRIKNKEYVDSLVKENLLPKTQIPLLHRNLPDKILFGKVFGSLDMAEIAKKFNAFKPDISVVIHYNVNETNIGWKHPTDRDYVMTFVGGCIVAKDLSSLGGRLNFLRLLLSPGIENSVELSSKVVKHLSADLSVPVAHKEDALYLSKNCLSTPADGVYARDLALTRLIRGTLVYGEALYQDNSMECCMLSGKGKDFKGCSISQRIDQVANAYYEGIVDYLNGLGKK